MSGVFFGPAGSEPPRTPADLDRFTKLPGVEAIEFAAGGPLTNWQRDLVRHLLEHGPAPFVYPRRAGRSTVMRAVARALSLSGDSMPSSSLSTLTITITPHVSAVRAAFEAAAKAALEATPAFDSRWHDEAWAFTSESYAQRRKRIRRREVEQRRIRQAMRHIERRAARRQRRAAARSVTR